MISPTKTWTDVRNSRRNGRHVRSAFMLIELVVVLVLISIVAGATVLSLRAPLQAARLRRAMTSIKDADQRARMEAQRSGQMVELTFDAREDTLTQTVGTGQHRSASSRSLDFESLTVDRFATAESSQSDERFTIRFSPRGRSRSYAVRLKPKRSNHQSTLTWLVVAGATGQFVEVREDSVVEAILQR